MTERLLSVDAKPLPGNTYRRLRLPGHAMALPDSASDRVAAELDRLYAAAEANQAPGPDWKAKLRPELTGAVRRLGDDLAPSATATWSAEVGDDVVADVRVLVSAMEDLLGWVALPDPLTPDPDAPPVYVPPEGHYAPVLGRYVPDGWEGQLVNTDFPWMCADECRGYPTCWFEVRRVPAPEPATEWVPLTKLVGRTLESATRPVWQIKTLRPGEWTVCYGENEHPLTVREDGMVEVLAEGERS